MVGLDGEPGAFKSMVQSMTGPRLLLEDVDVPVEDVQESGLIKDTIELRIPDESGTGFDGVFFSSASWTE